ncbi:hypothetical protein BDQ12DRAFT_680763 [Crucibulum laeve]|uniref:Uncharacterized protein n=1 Tax=Crucibulum laeve TaxID=68775 RepID=A0A5C3M4J2_9AGAR|nr:hypothetical protein BDQ12DRAFT_680763 [Crucibulum laeve]
MLCKRISRIRPLKTAFTRHLSDAPCPSPYQSFRKLRAFPFNVTPDEAITLIAPYAAILARKSILSSIAARVLPGFGFQPIQPSRLSPVYFPAWVIDAEVKADVTVKDSEQNAVAQFYNSYIPGSSFRVLSAAPLWSGGLVDSTPLPFTEDLTNIAGMEVQCIPYNISPFSALDIARSLPGRDAVIDKDMEFSPNSIKTNLLAAYPVLIPIYLAQYEYTLVGSPKVYTVTMFIEAHSRSSNVMSENSFSEFDQEYFEAFQQGVKFMNLEFDSNSPVFVFGNNAFTHVEAVSIPQYQDALESYVEAAIKSPGAAGALAERGMLDSDDDLRIREYTKEERQPITDWFNLGEEIMMMQGIINAMSSAKASRHVKVIGLGKNASPEEFVDMAAGNLKEKKEEAVKKRDEMQPTWWKEWQLSTKPKPDA